ncbi:MAG: class I SAM-dependent methyltransferase [Gemmatimonadota bacterium]|nr:class I SAM-dependent methyltransferase [Gemmatimonadota bacterium]
MLKTLGDNSDPASLATHMRRKRFAFFLSLLESVDRPLTILDVGGTQQFWDIMGRDRLAGASVTLFNLAAQPVSADNFESVTGDARDLSRFETSSFDVVFSNSVIEHLGPHFANQQRMADEIKRVGRRYFVQTPNRHFPIEPHFLVPGFQFMPLDFRVWLVSHFNVGWYRRIPDRARARAEVESVSLLTHRDLRLLFPAARIYRERMMGLTKSFVAYDGWTSSS